MATGVFLLQQLFSSTCDKIVLTDPAAQRKRLHEVDAGDVAINALGRYKALALRQITTARKHKILRHNAVPDDFFITVPTSTCLRILPKCPPTPCLSSASSCTNSTPRPPIYCCRRKGHQRGKEPCHSGRCRGGARPCRRCRYRDGRPVAHPSGEHHDGQGHHSHG